MRLKERAAGESPKCFFSKREPCRQLASQILLASDVNSGVLLITAPRRKRKRRRGSRHRLWVPRPAAKEKDSCVRLSIVAVTPWPALHFLLFHSVSSTHLRTTRIDTYPPCAVLSSISRPNHSGPVQARGFVVAEIGLNCYLHECVELLFHCHYL